MVHEVCSWSLGGQGVILTLVFMSMTPMLQFYIWALGYIDDVLLNHGGLPQVPPHDVHHEIFCAGQVRGVILRLFY